MKKILMFITAVVLSLTFFSCIEEDGAGVPMPKSLFVEHAVAGDTVVYSMLDAKDYLLRWHGLDNAQISVELSNQMNDLKQVVTEDMVPGELNTCSMTIPFATIEKYVADIQEKGIDAGVVLNDERLHVLINVTAVPVDFTKPTGLPEKGKTQTVLVRIVDAEPLVD